VTVTDCVERHVHNEDNATFWVSHYYLQFENTFNILLRILVDRSRLLYSPVVILYKFKKYACCYVLLQITLSSLC
jgi:hypothetical protein